jgi:outer membrane murein-binding lipoprotein Lpp
MKEPFILGAALLSTSLCGCASQQQLVERMQPTAVQVAQKRGAFELDCPAATADVLSKEMMQGAANPRLMRPERAEYTVGVSGCAKRAMYLVVCTVGGTGCVAGGTQNVIH